MEGENNIIDSNIVKSNGESGIGIWVDDTLKGTNITISRKVIVDHPKDSIGIDGAGKGAKPIDIKVCNNTIVSQKTAQYGIKIVNGANQVKVINNIITGS